MQPQPLPLFAKHRLLIQVLVVLATLAITANWLVHTPGNCAEKGFAIGASVCHQLPGHSFQLHGTQFPMCARCSGLYLGSLICLAYYFTQGKRAAVPKRFLLGLLFMFTMAWAGDGVNSLLSDFLKRPFLYATSNFTRLLTGFGMGLTLSSALMTLFNMTIWKQARKEALLRNFWQLLAYSLVCVVLGWALYSGDPFIFQTLAGLAILSVLVVIGMLYTIFWVIVAHQENRFTHLRELIFFILAGFATAMGQITLLIWLRERLLG